MSCTSDFLPRFRKHGFRMTAQRMAILHTLRHADGHLSPVQIFNLSRSQLPGLTEPTVYRTLDFLSRNGFARAAHMPNGRTVYELAERKHHHLVCRSCGSVLEVADLPGGGFYRQLEGRTGFRLDFNQLTLFGLCPQCQAKDRS